MAFRGHGALALSWWGDTVPSTGPTGTATIWVGNQIGFEVGGFLVGFRAYVANAKDGNFIAMLWKRDSQEIVVAEKFRIRASSGNQWHQTWRLPRYRVELSTVYRFGILFGGGAKFQTTNALTSAVTHNNITFENGWTSTNIFPILTAPTLTANAQGVDVLFSPD